MKRDLLNRTLFVLIAFFAFSLTTQAQLLMESFNYSLGNLYGQGDWWQYSTYNDSPDNTLKVVETSLTYSGYQDNPAGYAVELNNTVLSQSVVKKFAEGEAGINTGSAYYSALIQVKSAEEKENFIMAFIRSTYSGDIVDKKTRTEVAKLFVQKGSKENKFKLGVDRSLLNPTMTTEEFDLNVTYLVIVKYEVKEGDNNDEISLFVNPTDFEQEPAEAAALYNGTSGTDIGNFFIHAIELRQGATSSKAAPHVIIDELRVARSYAELFKLTPPDPEPTPEITCDPSGFFYFGYWGGVYAGETHTQDIIVKGKNLKGDITVGGMTSGEIIASTTTITKADAESENGYTLTLTFKPIKEGEGEDTITFSSEEAKETSISTGWTTTAIKEVADLSTLWQEDFSKFGIYKVTGEVTISHKQVVNNQTYYYLQDADKGMYLLDGFGDIQDADLKAGTKIKNLTGEVQNSWGGYIIPISGIKLYDIVSQDNTIAPKLVTLSELETNASKYKDMLVKVNNVELGWMKDGNFESVAVGDVFTEDAANRTIIKDADGKTITIRIFPEVDIIGTPTPATAHITGLSTSAAGNLIAPRSLADIEKLTDPVSIKSNKENALSIYADKGMIHIDGSEIHKAELYDITGNKVTETTAQELRGLTPALYLIKVTTAEGTVVKKLYVK